MDRRTSDPVDAIRRTEAGEGRLGAFARGALLGLALLAAFAVAISLATPPPGDSPPPGEIVAVDTRPVASAEQMAEGEPFSAAEPFQGGDTSTAEPVAAGRDLPASDGSADGAPNTVGEEPAVAAEAANAPEGAPERAGDAPGPADGPADGPVGAATEEPATAENVPSPDHAGDEPVSVVIPQAGTPGQADARAVAQPAGAEPDRMALAPGAAAASPAGPQPAGTEAVAATSAPERGGLPEAGASEPASADAEEVLTAAPDAGGEIAAPPPGAALVENASPFKGPPQAPMLAVVLVGEDVGALDAERLSLLPMPLTVAIPPEQPRAAEIGAAARASGHEVLADLSLAEGSEAGAAADRVAALDMAVGATATAHPADAGELATVLAEMRRHGLAWVQPGAGVGTPAERIARGLGVAFTPGDRSADGDDPEELRRAIDTAAAQALRRGTSVLFLDAGEPALQALVQWGLLQPGDNPVWFAPISAVIGRRAGK